MKFIPMINRSMLFFWQRKKEIFDLEFWQVVRRLLRHYFDTFVVRTHKEHFERNLSVLARRPLSLHIETTNICNANCIFCAYQYQKRPKIVLRNEIFEKALNEYCDIGGGELQLEVTVGDPLMDPNFLNRVILARHKPEITGIVTITNGIAAHKLGIQNIINSGISFITISTAPWDKKSYEEIYRNHYYNQMKQNVKDLLEANHSAGCPVGIKIAFRSNLSFKETLCLPDYQAIKHLPHQVDVNSHFDDWGGVITKEQLLPNMFIRPKTPIEKEPCIWLYNGPIIYADGKVGLCGCRDYNTNSELIVGNIMEQNLLDIWQSEKTMALRNRFFNGDYPDICKSCKVYVNLDMYRTATGTMLAQEIESRFLLSRHGKSLPLAGGFLVGLSR